MQQKLSVGGDAVILFQRLMALVKTAPWRDVRHAVTFCWMLVGLLLTGKCHPAAWCASVVSGAQQAQSHERRFQRGLSSPNIPRTAIYQHLMRQALQQWGETQLILALDTTLLFNTWCIICVSLVYRGRAVPLAWRILRHASSVVSARDLHPVLASVQSLLLHLPELEQVCINADRGFMDQELMADFTAYGWHWNIRGKGQVLVTDSSGRTLGKFRALLSQHGHLAVFNDVYLTAKRYGPVNIAAIHAFGAKEPWFIVSDEPGSPKTFSEYHERFQIEEGFLDFKSGGFNLETTRQTQRPHLEGLLFLLATASLFLLSEGTQVVEAGHRTQVDPHGQRGLSYFQIGWRAIRRQLSRAEPLLERLCLSAAPDPEPSRRRSCPLYFDLVRGFT